MSNQTQPVNIKRILYATDLSDSARYALNYAVDMANKYCAQIVILHVLDEIPDNVDSWVVGYIGSDKWDSLKKEYEDSVQAMLTERKRGKKVIQAVLDQFRTDLRPDVIADGDIEDEAVVRRGNPVSRILETAAEKECDMIVMGSHGHGNFLDAMLGSTASRVVRRSTVPVMVIRLPK